MMASVTLNDVLADPGRVRALPRSVRSDLLAQCAAVIVMLSNVADSSAPAEGARLLKVKEVAARLRCSRNHVYELIQRGELAAIRDGKSITVREDAIRDYLLQHERR